MEICFPQEEAQDFLSFSLSNLVNINKGKLVNSLPAQTVSKSFNNKGGEVWYVSQNSKGIECVQAKLQRMRVICPLFLKKKNYKIY